MRSLIMLIFCLGFISTTAHAQKMSWRKHAKLAKKQLEEGNVAEAAENFEAAWQKKTKKKEYIFQAAECYFQIKDYRKAAECYKVVKDDHGDFMLAGLKYCRSLKMDGQYDEASRAFVYLVNGYNEDDKEVVANIIQDEIRGCELAMTMLEKENENIAFEHLSKKVNSSGADFSPIPFSDDVLYYTSNMVGETKMYLTQKAGGVWSRSRVPKNFPRISADHFGNGAFSPDNKTFYYSQCDQIDASGRMIYGCQIYVTHRNDNKWSEPKKLNNNVNRAGSTSTHPFVVQTDEDEILYFSSDRSGGQGGMDIWMSIRNLDNDKMSFSKPVNLGKKINSMADEITPYFDQEENALYFSSNGNVNIGGFDVFKSEKKTAVFWEKAKNMGLPFNSSADDYYFIKYNSTGGYLVSNRKFGLEKTHFKDDDIFAFSIPTERMMATGKVFDKNKNQQMENVDVAIYEVTNSGAVRLLENKSFENGEYEFGLLPGKNYRVEAKSEGFATNAAEFSTLNNDQMNIENDLMLDMMAVSTTDFNSSNPSMETSSPSVVSVPSAERPSVNTNTSVPSNTTSTGRPNGQYNNPQPNSEMKEEGSIANRVTKPTMVEAEEVRVNTAPVMANPANEEGVVYKIQLMAVRKYRDSDERLVAPRNYGYIETEDLPSRNLTRVFLAGFQSKEEAEQIMITLKSNNRSFRTAVVVRYENGVRIDPWAK